MVQIKQRMVLMFLLFVFSIFVLVSGGFLSHQDTAWHQLAQESDQIIPARILIYVIFYPAYLILGAGIAMYAKRRLSSEEFDGKFKIALVCMTLAPFMFLPSQDPELLIWSNDW